MRVGAGRVLGAGRGGGIPGQVLVGCPGVGGLQLPSLELGSLLRMGPRQNLPPQ